MKFMCPYCLFPEEMLLSKGGFKDVVFWYKDGLGRFCLVYWKQMYHNLGLGPGIRRICDTPRISPTKKSTSSC